MTRQLIGALVLSLAAVLPTTGFGAEQSQDETEIRNVETRQQEAWNKHDAKAYADLFTEDGDCVNVVGWWWKGLTEIEKKLTDAYVFVFQESTLTFNDAQVRFLSPSSQWSTRVGR